MTTLHGNERAEVVFENLLEAIANSQSRMNIDNYQENILSLRECLDSKDNPENTFEKIFESSAEFFQIEANGQVTTIAGIGSVAVLRCSIDSGKWKNLDELYFIAFTPSHDLIPEQVTSEFGYFGWIYALMPSQILCCKTKYGAFIFPDLENNQLGLAFGLILVIRVVQEEPNQIDDDDGDEQSNVVEEKSLWSRLRDLLPSILDSSAESRVLPVVPKVPQSTIRATYRLAQDMVRRTENTGNLIRRRTENITRVPPTICNSRNIPHSCTMAIEYVNATTRVGSEISNFGTNIVGQASSLIGSTLAPHVEAQGAYMIAKFIGCSNTEAQYQMQNTMEALGSAVYCYSIILDASKKSAITLLKSLSENTVKIIEHRYGEAAAEAAENIFSIIGNLYCISRSYNALGDWNIGKTMLSDSGKALIDVYKPEDVDERTLPQSLPVFSELMPRSSDDES